MIAVFAANPTLQFSASGSVADFAAHALLKSSWSDVIAVFAGTAFLLVEGAKDVAGFVAFVFCALASLLPDVADFAGIAHRATGFGGMASR